MRDLAQKPSPWPVLRLWLPLSRMFWALILWGALPLAAPSAEPASQASSPSTTTPSRPDLSGLGGSFAGDARSPGQSSVSLFGLNAQGGKFVYVFDRSGSTGGRDHTALGAIKAELNASVDTLDSVQQFQLIFYNETPTIFNPSGQPGHLAFATDGNKRRAHRFIDILTAAGGTAHLDALKMAIRLQPSVIFWLTDAGEPQLQPAEVAEIRRWAAGITIHVVEFGSGPASAEDNFLKQVARQNNGQYVYVDLLRLAASEAQKPQ